MNGVRSSEGTELEDSKATDKTIRGTVISGKKEMSQ